MTSAWQRVQKCLAASAEDAAETLDACAPVYKAWTGYFSCLLAKEAATRASVGPHDREQLGADCAKLQPIAVKLLVHIPFASANERYGSECDVVHSNLKRRKSMGFS